jgi:SulP family sulfate permease
LVDDSAAVAARHTLQDGMRILRELGTGLASAVVSLAYCQSYAALIFSGPLQLFLPQGVTAALITLAVTASFVAITSGIRGAVAGPDGNTSPLLAVLLAGIVPQLQGMAPADALAVTMTALGLATLIAGLVLFGAGWRRLSKFVRFIPYPVVSGFLASTGWLIVSGAVVMATGVPLHLSALAAFADPQPLRLLILALACAAGLLLLTDRFKQPLTLPIALAIVTLVTNIALHLALAPDAIRASGLMFDMTGGSGLVPPLLSGKLAMDWSIFTALAGNIASIAIMCLITVLLNSTSLELAAGTEIDLDREIRMQGIANILAALAGGFVGFVSVSRTVLNRATGGTGPLSGLVVGLVAVAVLAFGSDAMSVLPRFLMGGMLLLVGGKMMWDWAIVARRRMPVQDWLVVLATLGITASWGFLAALIFGIVAACVMFVIDVSRTRTINHQFGLDERCSSVLRSTEDMQLLAAHGASVQVLELTGYIFFGSAYALQQHVKAMIAERKPTSVMFDFTGVSGIDSSAGAGFAKISRMLRQAGIREFVVGLAPDRARILRGAGALPSDVRPYSTLDAALEEAEAETLDALRDPSRERASLRNWLSGALGSADHARVLAEYLTPAKAQDRCLCRQGDATDSLLFIEAGRVSVMLERPGQAPLRVRVFGAHTIVGEVGFFLDAPRTATLYLEEESAVWALYRPAFERLKSAEPDLVAALFTYVIQLQSERLAFATRQIAALQR